MSSNNNLYEFYVNNNLSNKLNYHFKDNKIDTTKYNCITFLPKALLFQFMRPANIYFLICAIIQCIPAISPLDAETALIPIIIVLSVSLIREGIEDCARARLDKEQNSEPAEVYRDNQWEKTQSGDLLIGEIVEVKQDFSFPADLILIDSSLPEGICFIETGTLDGEKTLKLKNSPTQTAGKFNNESKNKIENFNASGNIICDHPNPALYQLNGKFHFNINGKESDIPLDAKQLLLKGAKLRNTQWIIGIVCYTGHNCKIIQNSKEPRTKYSSVETLMNYSLLIIFGIQTFLCIISAICRGLYYKKNIEDIEEGLDLDLTEYSYGVEGLISYFTYLLLLNTMIPISLIVTLEIVKLIQGLFMKADIEGYSKIRNKYISPNSVSLNEELGLVNYIFSDKTGTLTCNKMQFKYCVIGDVCYEFIKNKDDELDKKNREFRNNENIKTFKEMEMYDKDINKISDSFYPDYKAFSSEDPKTYVSLDNSAYLIHEFWQALALCHDCSIQKNDDGTEDYIAMSPDSIELVRSAKLQGYALTESEISSMKRIKLGEKDFKDMERLCLMEFSSDRKRESVIVRDNNIIKLYIKGADSIIKERLSPHVKSEILNQCQYFVDKFSSQGFRTLFVGMKVLTEKEYNTFADLLYKANMDLNNKEEKVAEAYATVEKDIFLLGTTIVEDKLQDKVPETIRDLRLGGIKIWMLTGDKMNTAYNIGLSCNLISKKMKIFTISGIEPKKNEKLQVINNTERYEVIYKFAKEFEYFKGEFQSMSKRSDFGVLIDEKALLTVCESEEMEKIFLNIAKDAVAVICCRVSPLQKSQVVKMMKNYDPKAITLAIGDGGNDVSMIMEAHIGVGIYGEEGLRAVQSSDYAIGEFKILYRLLFFHGRTFYIRNSECVRYFFYKNFVFTIIQFFYGFLNNFSGQTIIDDWYITLFNLLFTSLPLGARACLEFDVKPEDGIIVTKLMPWLYSETRDYPIFTLMKFFLKLIKGLIHCVINYLWVVYSINNNILDGDGNMESLWLISVNLFSNIILIVSFDLMIYTNYHTWINIVIMLVSTFIFYIIFLIMVHYIKMFNSVGSMYVSFSSSRVWMNVIFICGFCFLIDNGIKAFKFLLYPSYASTLQRIISENGKCDSEKYLPKTLIEKVKIYDEDEDIIEEKKEKNEGFIYQANTTGRVIPFTVIKT